MLTAEGVTGIENGNIHGQAGEIFGVVREREEYNAWARSLYYETEFGLIFRDKLIISADGISWKGVNTPLDEVEGMSWGGIRQRVKYVNGVYMKSDYWVTIYTPYSTIKLTPKDDKYEQITSHLWRALIEPIFRVSLLHQRHEHPHPRSHPPAIQRHKASVPLKPPLQLMTSGPATQNSTPSSSPRTISTRPDTRTPRHTHFLGLSSSSQQDISAGRTHEYTA